MYMKQRKQEVSTNFPDSHRMRRFQKQQLPGTDIVSLQRVIFSNLSYIMSSNMVAQA